MTDDSKVTFTLKNELTDKETYLLGMIMSQWGRLEHMIFIQTLSSFEDAVENAKELPRAMNNIRFSAVLDLWQERVMEKADDETRATLREQLEEFEH